MKFLTYFMTFLALCTSTRCWSMYGGYYGRPAAPASGNRVMTQQEYQAYLAQQAQQRAGSASQAPVAQPKPPQSIPASQPNPEAVPEMARPIISMPKVRFSDETTSKTPEKYPSEVAEEEQAAASVEPTEDENELAKRKRTAIRKSKWSLAEDEAAASDDLEREQKEGTSDIKKGMTRQESKAARKKHMQELGIKMEKAKGSFW